jgi:hypothetical protein
MMVRRPFGAPVPSESRLDIAGRVAPARSLTNREHSRVACVRPPTRPGRTANRDGLARSFKFEPAPPSGALRCGYT